MVVPTDPETGKPLEVEGCEVLPEPVADPELVAVADVVAPPIGNGLLEPNGVADGVAVARGVAVGLGVELALA